MSPARRLLLSALGVVVAVVVAVAVLAVVLRGDDGAPRATPVAQDRPGPVLLVPGYGGNTVGLRDLAARLTRAGRVATVVELPGDGTGDLEDSALRLRAAADAATARGAPSVDVVGYSAGGVVARIWAKAGGTAQARRIVTLGSPSHGTQVAALGAVFAAGACPRACQQLVPGSSLLDGLNAGDETPDGPGWLSVWTTDDAVVTPPDSARIEGALPVVLQELCPGIRVDHGQLPHDAVVQAVVLQALSAAPLTAPGPELCRPSS
ncbi:MAG: estB [Frankiales bacterium]|nr:estB [Frankiales bacterium]